MEKTINHQNDPEWNLFDEDAEDMMKPSYFKKRDRRDRSVHTHYRPYEHIELRHDTYQPYRHLQSRPNR